MDRAPGLSVRLKLTLSYAGFLVLAGASLLALWAALLRYFPEASIIGTTLDKKLSPAAIADRSRL